MASHQKSAMFTSGFPSRPLCSCLTYIFTFCHECKKIGNVSFKNAFIKIDNQIDKAYIRTFPTKFLIFLTFVYVFFFYILTFFSYILIHIFLHSYPQACETAVWWVRMCMMHYVLPMFRWSINFRIFK